MSNPPNVPRCTWQPIYDEATAAVSQSRCTRPVRPSAPWGVVVGLLLLAGVMPFSSWAETPAVVPLLKIDAPIQDLGQLTRGEVGMATFQLANRGSAPLEIVRVKPG
jgi:hypothetical protein